MQTLRSLAAAVGLGLALAGLAACGTGGDKATQVGPRMIVDHWHTAYGVWLCDHYIDDLVDRHGDRYGLHTHDDGIIHIHPVNAAAAGANATLARFATEVGIGLRDDRLDLPDGTTRANGDGCPTGPGRLAVYRWAPTTTGDAAPTISTVKLGRVPLRDRDALAVVFAPEGASVPPPWSVYSLDFLADVAPRPGDSGGPGVTSDHAAGAKRGPTATLPPPPTSSSTTPPVTSAPPLPAGDRASFKLWLVERTVAPNADGQCPPGTVNGWPGPDPGGGPCYQPAARASLGPDILRHAQAVQDRARDWVISLTLSDAGLERFNQLISPGATLAFEFGGRVLSAPTVQTDHFSDPQLTLTARFGEQQAKSLARALDAG